jgi:signal transduction histidine kinase
VLADRGELFTLLKNLVENALDFSPEGGIVRIVVGAGGLAVEDEGPGVPEDRREKVFERFWRGTQGDRPGSGLGLAICLEVAAAHGWRIVCTQAALGGARFEVTFAGP